MLAASSPSATPDGFVCPKCGKRWAGLRTEHCPAPGCHQTFTGSTAGDMHRVGDHSVKTGLNRRRCLTPEEMLALRTKKGEPRLRLNEKGVWGLAEDNEWRGGRDV